MRMTATILALLCGVLGAGLSTATAACGDGVVDAGEACDDGNHANCDGCSTGCAAELTESAPNDSIAGATGPLVPNACAFGAIEKAGDVDVFSFTVGSPTSVRLETFDASGQGRCANVDTSIQLLGGSGDVLAADDDGGIRACSRINAIDAPGARDLAPGTYFVRVTAGGGAAYALLVSTTATGATCAGRPATLVGTADDEVLVGTPGSDVILGKRGNDHLRGKLGADALCGGRGDDEISGGKDGDVMRGGGGNDHLVGGAGDDELLDTQDTNTLDGRDGTDRCTGATANTILNCEPIPPSSGASETTCNDAVDGDGDGLIDCADPDCDAAACDDANECTVGDTCTQNVCVGSPVNCDDGNDCTADICVAGFCQYQALDQLPCDDESACTVNDVCITGQCTGAPGTEDCFNLIDDDCDELVDGDDPDCIP